MSKTTLFKSIYRFVASLPAFSDHDHHQTDAFFRKAMSLDRLLQNSYVAWTGFAPDGSRTSREALLDHARFNTYFVWIEKGIQAVHGIRDRITLDTWEKLSRRIRDAYRRDPDFHWNALRRHGYETLVLDTFWNPGDDGGHPELFKPTFRIDKFMYGHHAEAVAPNEFIPWQRYGFKGGRFDDYLELMSATIRARHRAGRAVALKCAEAYNRSISFQPDDRAAARRAFGVSPDRITPEQKILFGNSIFNRCCELAAELDIPFQVHTGLAQLSGSQPMNFEPTILRHPRTRFVLFHSGFPWTHQVAGLAHNHPNVLPSLTWTATICTAAAIRALHDYIDVARSINTITWGSDCWTAEESVGALLAWRFIVATVLAERLEDGRLVRKDAEALARKLMFENGRRVYLKR